MTEQNQTRTQDMTRHIEHRNAVECYKAELIELIELGMFYTARNTLTKCIKEISDYSK